MLGPSAYAMLRHEILLRPVACGASSPTSVVALIERPSAYLQALLDGVPIDELVDEIGREGLPVVAIVDVVGGAPKRRR